MKRRILKLAIALLLIPTLAIIWLLFSESALQLAYQRALPYLPGQLSVAQLEGRLTGPITLNKLHYQHQGVEISAEQLIIDWHPSALLGGAIELTQLHGRTLLITLTDPQRTEPLTLPDIHLPWRLAVRDVQLDDLHIEQGEQAFAIQQFKLDADALFNRIDIEQLKLTSDDYSVSVKGRLNPSGDYRHDLKVGWRYTLPTTQTLIGSGSIEGDIKQSHITQRIDGPLQLTLNGDLYELLQQLRWQATINASTTNLALLDSALPSAKGKIELHTTGNLNSARFSGKLNGQHPDSGPLDASFSLRRTADNAIAIKQLMLHSQLNDTRLNAQGRWQPGEGGGNVDLTLHWQQLRWPLSGNAWFDSAIGSGWLKGNINHYQFGIATDRPWPQVPPSDWFASGEGNLDGIHFHSLRLRTLEGDAEAIGQLDWTPQLAWNATITLADIDPAALMPEWSGKLHGQLLSQGSYTDGQLNISADIQTLNGRLRGYPVTLTGKMAWRDNGLEFANTEFHSADSIVTLNGRVAERLDLDWAINATDLATLYPRAQGALVAQGNLSGPRQTPSLNTTLNGDGLAFAGYMATHLEGAVLIDPQDWQTLDIDLSAEGIKFADHSLNSLQLTATNQQLQLNAQLDSAEIALALQGTLDNQQWQGTIEQADVTSPAFGEWRLETATPLSITAATLKLDSPCWHNNDARLCIDLLRDQNTLQGGFKLQQLPLALLQLWLPPDLELNGTSDGEGRFNLAAEQPTGHATLTLSAGSITYPLIEGKAEHWHYLGGTLEATLDETGIKAQADLAISENDHLRARLQLPNAQLLTLDPARQPIKGSAQLTVHDLGLIEAIVPEIQDLQGALTANLDISGTLDQPRLNGRIDLDDGSLRVPRLGLNIDQLALHGQTRGKSQLDFRLDARSGDGQLAVKGTTMLDPASGWPTEITIKGQDFEAAKIPEARVLISPDLQVHIQHNTIRTEGTIHIPYAKIQPKDVTTAVRESEDTVIIGGEQVINEKWIITTRIRLTLGDRVQFYGFGFEGYFGGSLLLEDAPGQLTKATGELNVTEGRYRAYGQRLDVERGRLLYTGGPLTNPGLDFRSVRRIGMITAGLRVRGTLSQPQIELFSIPAMGETDVLSYLLLGRPLETATGEEGAMMAKATLALGLSGGDRLARTLGDRFGLDEMRIETSETDDQAALVMGRYLSPKLYISYGVGLIDAVNIFSVRYQISDKWQLKGESGEHQGADLLYTIER